LGGYAQPHNERLAGVLCSLAALFVVLEEPTDRTDGLDRRCRPRSADPYMSPALVSGTPDIRDLPLDADVIIDDAEYAHIMRRIGVAEGEPSVSAFNSSI
jgi:hypothetical protein